MLSRGLGQALEDPFLGPVLSGLYDRSLAFSFQDMFDPHGWSEDSYYEALGNLD